MITLKNDSFWSKFIRFMGLSIVIVFIVSCSKSSEDMGNPLQFTVVQAQHSRVPIHFEFIGQTQSVATVDILARVEGFLLERAFEEGEDITAGDLLFQIDPSLLQAQVDAQEADVLNNLANVEFWELELERAVKLFAENTIPKEQYDTTVSQRDQAVAQLEQSQANLELATLNLSYTTMTAPFDGRIGLSFVDVGNLVGADTQTLLATIVQLDPMRVLFNPSERDYTQMLEQLTDDEDIPFEVTITAAGNETNIYHGQVDFINNTVDPSTATLLMRAVVENHDKRLLPGMYVNVSLYLKDNPNAILLPVTAVNLGQGFEYVYVVDDKNMVHQKVVKTAVQYQEQAVVIEGLDVGDRVITSSLQLVRAGAPLPGIAVDAAAQESTNQNAE